MTPLREKFIRGLAIHSSSGGPQGQRAGGHSVPALWDWIICAMAWAPLIPTGNKVPGPFFILRLLLIVLGRTHLQSFLHGLRGRSGSCDDVRALVLAASGEGGPEQVNLGQAKSFWVVLSSWPFFDVGGQSHGGAFFGIDQRHVRPDAE